MRIRALAIGIVWTASLYGQHRRFSWQNYCFEHPAAPVCPGHEYAIKSPKSARGATNPSVGTNPFPPASGTPTPSVIVVGGNIDWRFADPLADGLVGFNIRGLTASPLARGLLVQLGTRRGFNETDLQKIFDGLSGVDQIALSVRDNRIVAMLAGSVTDLALPADAAGLKAAPVSRNAMLVGHADAVDQALQRIESRSVASEPTKLADELQAGGEFWVAGSAGLVGPQAVSAGMQRFSAKVSIKNQAVTSYISFEFDGAPGRDTLQLWQTLLGAAIVDGNRVHFRTSMAADEALQKFGQIATGPFGEQLADLLEATRYLPVRAAAVQKHTQPVIHGLEPGQKK